MAMARKLATFCAAMSWPLRSAPTPLDIIGADTQGSIGYMLQQALRNRIEQPIGIHKPVVSVVTQVLVDEDDPAFQNPNKPIGGFMEEEEAQL